MEVSFDRLANPDLWDPEHPHLYTLEVDLDGGSQTTGIRVGIRDVRIEGSTVLVNGRAIKGRGTTRHETHPFAGRSLWYVCRVLCRV